MVLDHGLYTDGEQEAPFYVMPFYPTSLRTLMASGITHENVLPMFAQCLDGVEAAHLQGVIHRDLKPENILCDRKGDRLVVADFGVAEFAQDELYTLVETKPNTRLANFQYAAPEQRQRGGVCDQRTDVFALGLMLNEMFTGVVPQGTGYPTIGAIAPQFAYLDELVSWMIRQNAADRLDSIDVVKRELIGRRNAFVDRQELNKLKQTVIISSEVDDPLVADPIRLLDAYWDGRVLTMTLSQPVNHDWTQAIQFGNYSKTSLLGKGPSSFTLHVDTASVAVGSNEVQQAIDYFEQWLPHANAIYSGKRKQEKQLREREQRDALEREIGAREKRESISTRLKV
jgi:serine/threonine protein kinase